MFGLNAQPIGCRHQRIGLSLQVLAATLLDLGLPGDQADEKGIHLLSHLGCRAKADVPSNFFADPGPDGLYRANRLLLQ
jgi:hypothetical protein